MQIIRDIDTRKGPADWFTGDVPIDAVAAPAGTSNGRASPRSDRTPALVVARAAAVTEPPSGDLSPAASSCR